uniref:Dystrophin-like n=1 Tax=Dermatophagoides pteronyssinus TaxID=6956 RepID=A0A6P6YBE2_DERPT|nr:dystrophin-like [Dermatophagoides pteronyssinus]
MERIRDIQREHHQRSLQQLLLSTKQQQQQQQSIDNNDGSNSKKIDNVYDTVADVMGDNIDNIDINQQSLLSDNDNNSNNSNSYYNRPNDLPEISKKYQSTNLDMQRQDIEQWLDSMEQRLANISIVNNQFVQQNQNNQNTTQNNKTSVTATESKDLKSQLTILSDYESECNQYSYRLQTLCNSIDSRISSLTSIKLNEKNQSQQQQQQQQSSSSTVINSNNISMPYYEHLIKLRKQASDMQCRCNYLYLCIKCKTRSLNELLSLTSSSSNRNLLMSMVNGGSSSGTDLDNYGTQSSKKSSKSISSIKSTNLQSSSPDTSTTTTAAAAAASSSSSLSQSQQITSNNQISSSSNNNINYSLHEQSEKRFNKWLAEMEQSLDFIEKGLAAESALININNDGTITNINNDDTSLYSNVSEMQQMHMNYYEKIKIIQREIEQKRTDHRLLMELLDNIPISTTTTTTSATSTSTTTTNQDSKSSISNNRQQQQQQQQSIDPWLLKFRNRIEQMNGRWNNVRLRVLTLRSRLESSSFVNKSLTSTLTTKTTCPVPVSYSTVSLYSVINNNQQQNYGWNHQNQHQNNDNESIISSTINLIAYNNIINERSQQLILSLRELTEWIIKQQMEFQQKQQQQQIPIQFSSSDHNHHQQQIAKESDEIIPLDIANVLQQKTSLIQLRNQLIEKRPIIDSSLLSCHNFLRRLAVKRAQDVQQQQQQQQRLGNQSRISASTSIASSIAGSTINNNNDQQQQQQQQRKQQQQQNGQQIEKLELSLNREMNKLLELWHSVQSTVDIGLQRLDEAHLRLNDLQRVMDDLAAKLHEAEMVKSKWIPIINLTFDDLPQQRSQLKTYNQMYVVPVSRDVIHVNEIAARLTGRNVPLSHGNLKSLEEVTTRARLLRISIDERSRELDQIQQDHGRQQQHFLTEAVDEPWERAVTNNKLPCYINRQTETVHLLSPRYIQIIDSMNEFNDVRYAAYRTAMKLRRLQLKLGLNYVNLNNLVQAFEQYGLGPNNNSQRKLSKNLKSDNTTNDDSSNDNKKESTTTNNREEDNINDDLPYELRLISVPDIVSCLKKIFETAEIERQQQEERSTTTTKTSSNKKQSKDKENVKILANNNADDNDLKSSSSSMAINIPICVDLCLNWLLDLYDAPSRAGFIRQFSFQVALVLLSHISLEQKYIYLFNLIANNDNHCADERRFGLLIYDCLRLPKLLGEVAAFGGTNVEPSVRSCLEMSLASGLRSTNTINNGNGNDGGSITIDQVLAWIRAEPQSLVWLIVLHRLRLAENSLHPAKCNSCRKYPIKGFRYRCLKCFNFDLCQYCFLSDKSIKKHKPSHPMQEYCIATTSGEDMRDFSKILRNKFKSGRYFKRHQALGYLPVQSLHEGDRLVANINDNNDNNNSYNNNNNNNNGESEYEPSYVHTLQGSYSHAPSSNTTPVHTLTYPQRSISPGSSMMMMMNTANRKDLDFQFIHQQQQQSQHYTSIRPGPLPPLPSMNINTSGIYGTRSIYQQQLQQQQQRKQQQQQIAAASSANNQSPSGHRILPTITTGSSNNVGGDQNQFVRISPSRSSLKSNQNNQNQNNDDIHQRLGKYANRLAEIENQQQQQQQRQPNPILLNRSESLRSNGRSQLRTGRFDSLQPMTTAALNQLPSNHPHRRSSLNQPGSGERHHHHQHLQFQKQQQQQPISIQSPTEMLSKIAADQRNELEIIIQRLQEENRLLMNEYSQLKGKDDDDDDEKSTKKTTTNEKNLQSSMDKAAKSIDIDNQAVITNGSGQNRMNSSSSSSTSSPPSTITSPPLSITSPTNSSDNQQTKFSD